MQVSVYTYGAPLVFAAPEYRGDLPPELTRLMGGRVHSFVLNADIVPRLLGSGLSATGVVWPNLTT
jgi:hypothetical protein